MSAPASCSRVGWCDGMSEALEGVPKNSDGKGLSVMFGLSEPPRPFDFGRLIGVVYHKKAYDRGLVLNVCPWCGADILFDKVGR